MMSLLIGHDPTAAMGGMGGMGGAHAHGHGHGHGHHGGQPQFPPGSI